MTATLTMRDAVDAYRAGNNRGEGYAPDTLGDDSVDAAVDCYVREHGATVLLARSTTDDVAVVRTATGHTLAIGGDALGKNAWAVSIEAST